MAGKFKSVAILIDKIYQRFLQIIEKSVCVYTLVFITTAMGFSILFSIV